MTESELYHAVTHSAGTQVQIAQRLGVKLWKVIAIQAEERQRVKTHKPYAENDNGY